MFSNTLTKLSLIPPCLFPDGKTLLEKWMYLMPCRHFQGNCRESHHPSLLPASHRMGSSFQLWVWAGLWCHGDLWGMDVALMWGWGTGFGPAEGWAGTGTWLGFCVCHVSLLWFSSLAGPTGSAPACAIWSIFENGFGHLRMNHT